MGSEGGGASDRLLGTDAHGASIWPPPLWGRAGWGVAVFRLLLDHGSRARLRQAGPPPCPPPEGRRPVWEAVGLDATFFVGGTTFFGAIRSPSPSPFPRFARRVHRRRQLRDLLGGGDRQRRARRARARRAPRSALCTGTRRSGSPCRASADSGTRPCATPGGQAPLDGGGQHDRQARLGVGGEEAAHVRDRGKREPVDRPAAGEARAKARLRVGQRGLQGVVRSRRASRFIASSSACVGVADGGESHDVEADPGDERPRPGWTLACAEATLAGWRQKARGKREEEEEEERGCGGPDLLSSFFPLPLCPHPLPCANSRSTAAGGSAWPQIVRPGPRPRPCACGPRRPAAGR